MIRWFIRWIPALAIGVAAGWLAIDTFSRGLGGTSATVFGQWPAPVEALAWTGLALAMFGCAVFDARRRLRRPASPRRDRELVSRWH